MSCPAKNEQCNGSYGVAVHCDRCKTRLYSVCPFCGALVPEQPRGPLAFHAENCRPLCRHEQTTPLFQEARRVLRDAVGVLLLSIFIGCALPAPKPLSDVDPVPVVVPFRCVVLQDVSGSANNIPRVSMEDVDRLVERILAGDGELAFSTVGAGSPPLVRLPLCPPVVPSLVVTERNVFRAARQHAELERRRVSYEGERASFRASSEPLIQDFRSAVRGMLGRHEQVTDLVSGLERASLFLNEPSPGAVRVVLLVSDGLDTRRHENFQLGFEGVHFVMVSASQDLGMLNRWRDRIAVFESPDAAVSYVLSLASTP